MKRRWMSMLLVLCMVFTLFPSAVFAEKAGDVTIGSTAIGTDSAAEGAALCENHKEHDIDCGYIEAKDARPCGDLNEDGSYSCAPVEDSGDVSGNTATPGDAEEKYVCDHSDGCGYAEAVDGADCTHKCELCLADDADKDIIADACVCEVLCTENLMNPDCKVCAVEGADLTKCVGKAAEKPPVCICVVQCTPTPECICPPVDSGELVHGEDCPLSDPETAVAQINPDCPFCAAEGAAAMMMVAPRAAIGENFEAFITVDGNNVLCTFKVLTNNTVQVGKETVDGNTNGAVAQAIDKTTVGVVVIPGTVSYGGANYTVTAIGKNAFFDCSEITGVSIPDSVTAIGSRAFYACRALTSVIIPSGVKTIGDFAFVHCYALGAVSISEGVKSIGKKAFFDCNLLTKVVLPKTAPTVPLVNPDNPFSPDTKLYRPADATGYDTGNWTDNEYIKRLVTLLTFTDSASFNIPASKMGVAITSIDVSGAVKGGQTPYSFAANGLPAGITIDSSTGIIGGTPTAARDAKSADIFVYDQSSPKQIIH